MNVEMSLTPPLEIYDCSVCHDTYYLDEIEGQVLCEYCKEQKAMREYDEQKSQSKEVISEISALCSSIGNKVDRAYCADHREFKQDIFKNGDLQCEECFRIGMLRGDEFCGVAMEERS